MDLGRSGDKPRTSPGTPKPPPSVVEVRRFVASRGWLVERDPRGWLTVRPLKKDDR